MQDQPGSGIRVPYLQTLRNTQPDIIAFPEYYFVDAKDNDVLASKSRKNEVLALLKAWSLDFHCLIVGGTVVEADNHGLHNRCYLVNDGEVVGHYDKIHPLDREGRGQISGGTEYKVFDHRDSRIGVLICADVLYPHSFSNIRGLRPDSIFVPTTSPYRPGESREEKFSRDVNIFAIGAKLSQSIIVKVSACGSIAGHRLQGRSLIASPGKILWRIEPEDENKSTLAIADLSCDLSNPSLDITVHRQ